MARMRLEDLPATGTCDLTTIGRRSGTERTVEIWFVRVDGAVHVVGTPGPRSWIANLRADPRASLSFGDSEFRVVATEVTDVSAREHVARGAWDVQPWYTAQGHSIDDWVARSPMVRLALTP
ncbi:nitroreductase family deazaflavin-dependent oxidoreductase [Arsenicicoccus sp. oral taxon 190]|uniref:nitroreductase family deazaflavin-dependent oxidoreductase n=1 Tax=Arsenicicoccus sp. oral taxon 190 TaxID=1658671 RepID=UPI000679FC23|nr:nitroreductase family deazaflavin-dependent oxidoreductase [Arsenicicoccus sp. oral taxon 190]AKT51873.1 hypothetical protein ADJ73_12385 [Arsenicicoccus sp. oral taxon 190]